ncbi:MAG: FtsQ-type POTRA domain-containing protein [Oscillospiraceae bacterium]|jgi:cell division protein FtsQ|nr:FtsQ-type POTRA domain-containing protein [Oscillospiraceae bacterium]
MKENSYAHVDEYIVKKRTRIARQKRKRRNRVISRVFFLLLLLIALLVCVYFSLGIFFNVKNILLSGESRYSREQILKASKIRKGENIFFVNLNRVRENIEKGLLYVGNVDVKLEFPVSVLIVVNDAKPMCALKDEKGYVILSDGLKILGQNVLTIDESLDIIKGVKLATPILGEKVEDETALDKLNGFTVLNGYMKKAGLKNMRMYDLEDLQDIRLYSRDEKSGIRVRFGGMDQAEHKVKFLAEALDCITDKEMLSETGSGISGELDLTRLVSSGKAIWRPKIDDRAEVVGTNDKEVTKNKRAK